jgi:hypothetical protein
VSRPSASRTITPTPIAATTWISRGRPSRKLQNPAARPRVAIANRSRIRSMNTVPTVRLRDTELLIFRR